MKNRKIDYSEIPSLSAAAFRKGRRLTSVERAQYAQAYLHTFGEHPPKVGRPYKYANARLKPISIRLHANVLGWAKREAQKKNMGYQSFINEFLMRHTA